MPNSTMLIILVLVSTTAHPWPRSCESYLDNLISSFLSWMISGREHGTKKALGILQTCPTICSLTRDPEAERSHHTRVLLWPHVPIDLSSPLSRGSRSLWPSLFSTGTGDLEHAAEQSLHKTISLVPTTSGAFSLPFSLRSLTPTFPMKSDPYIRTTSTSRTPLYRLRLRVRTPRGQRWLFGMAPVPCL